jgi:hypothetical protein
LAPQWHGSDELIYGFQLKCTQSQRFDSMLPAIFMNSLLGQADPDMEKAHGADPKYAPEVYEQTVRTALLGYAKEPKPGILPYQLHTVKFNLAVKDGEFLQAAKYREEAIQHSAYSDSLYRHMIRQGFASVIETIASHSAPFDDTIRKWQEAAKSGKVDEILPQLEMARELIKMDSNKLRHANDGLELFARQYLALARFYQGEPFTPHVRIRGASHKPFSTDNEAKFVNLGNTGSVIEGRVRYSFLPAMPAGYRCSATFKLPKDALQMGLVSFGFEVGIAGKGVYSLNGEHIVLRLTDEPGLVIEQTINWKV